VHQHHGVRGGFGLAGREVPAAEEPAGDVDQAVDNADLFREKASVMNVTSIQSAQAHWRSDARLSSRPHGSKSVPCLDRPSA